MQYYAALNQAAQALQGTIYTADRNLDASKYAADQNLAGVQYTADKNVEAAGVTAKGNVDAADVAGSWNFKAADKTGYWNNQAAATAGQYNVQAADKAGYWNNLAAATAGQYNVQAAEASNAAQAAYYEYLKNQAADNDFITQWAKISENYAAAIKAGDIDTAAQWLMAMGLNYKEARAEAEKAYKNFKKKNTPPATVQLPEGAPNPQLVGIFGPTKTQAAIDAAINISDILRILFPSKK
jgi:coenzyme F420-reducing hydrogenase alpha subunit